MSEYGNSTIKSLLGDALRESGDLARTRVHPLSDGDEPKRALDDGRRRDDGRGGGIRSRGAHALHRGSGRLVGDSP